MRVFDAHFHIIDPAYPLQANNGYLPEAFTVRDYQSTVKGKSVTGGAIVSGSFQAFDQNYLIATLKAMGEGYYGVANIAPGTKAELLNTLDKAGVKAVRFNLKRGGSAGLKDMVKLSNDLYERFNWRTELYVDSNDLSALSCYLKQLPAFSIDHLGLSASGLKDLLFWADQGVRIKATGFGRIDFDPIAVMKQIHEVNPDALMFGTDVPSTRAKRAFLWEDQDLITANFTPEEADKILYANAVSWYELK